MPLKTQILKINPQNPDLEKIKFAANKIMEGKLVAFPTETVYGLGANALDKNAVAKIFAAKGRPADNPLIVHISSNEELSPLVSIIPRFAEKLIKHFWPGPLTIIFPKKNLVPDITTANSPFVAIRQPNHPVALLLIKEAGVPIAAPSANLSGRPSPTTADHVINDLYGKVDIIIDSGEVSVGVESTVLNLTGKIPQILRPGGLSLEEIENVLGIKISINSDPSKESSAGEIKSPGTRYTHYKPKGEVTLIENNYNKNKTVGRTLALIEQFALEGHRTALISPYEINRVTPNLFLNMGSSDAEQAKNVFAMLRQCDQNNIDKIIVIGVSAKGLGLAVMDRLRRAASNILTLPSD